MLGQAAALGRVFAPDEDSLGKPATAVLSYGMWLRHFGVDPRIVSLDRGPSRESVTPEDGNLDGVDRFRSTTVIQLPASAIEDSLDIFVIR
jgi:hypothetical protein